MTASESGGRRRWSTREIAVLGVLGAVLFVAKMAMALLPNIEPVSLLVMVYAMVFGRQVLWIVFPFRPGGCPRPPEGGGPAG